MALKRTTLPFFTKKHSRLTTHANALAVSGKVEQAAKIHDDINAERQAKLAEQRGKTNG